jgi:hypothetical protein
MDGVGIPILGAFSASFYAFSGLAVLLCSTAHSWVPWSPGFCALFEGDLHLLWGGRWLARDLKLYLRREWEIEGQLTYCGHSGGIGIVSLYLPVRVIDGKRYWGRSS